MKEEKLDLRGIKCPLNFVKIKLKFKKLQKKDRLLISLDLSEEIQLNLRKSLDSEEIKILKFERKEDFYFLLVEK